MVHPHFSNSYCFISDMFVGHWNLACSWLTVVVGLTQNVAVNKTAFMRMWFCVMGGIFLGQHLPELWVKFHELNLNKMYLLNNYEKCFLET